MIVSIVLSLMLINTIKANRLLEGRGLSPAPTNCAALLCLEGYSCCYDNSGDAYCCIPSESTDICSLPKVVGLCRASIPRYYYDSTEQICKPFSYGGCNGNENNFHTLTECNRHCGDINPSTTSSTDDHCSLSPDSGPCGLHMPRFYHDALNGQCKLFIYGGCKGNKNRFKSKKECIHECDTSLDTFDWESALEELETRKALWQSNGVLKYVYHLETVCFCMSCHVAGKYIEVKEDVATKVEFDADAATYCNASDVEYPIDENYMDINGIYDEAIAHVTNGMNADCDDDEFPDGICGGGIVITYDDVLNYPTYASLQYGSFIADAGISYTMDCLTVIDITEENEGLLDEYENECIETYDLSTTDICSKSIGDVCDLGDECCEGFCGIARWDNTVNVCCYHDKYKDISCQNNGDCCDGYKCDGKSKLCVES